MSELQFLDEVPKTLTKSQIFWMNIRKQLEQNPGKFAKVNTYNHPTVAYRARRDILEGLNDAFPEKGEWGAKVIKNESSAFYGPRSGRVTYLHDLYMIYTPK